VAQRALITDMPSISRVPKPHLSSGVPFAGSFERIVGHSEVVGGLADRTATDMQPYRSARRKHSGQPVRATAGANRNRAILLMVMKRPATGHPLPWRSARRLSASSRYCIGASKAGYICSERATMISRNLSQRGWKPKSRRSPDRPRGHSDLTRSLCVASHLFLGARPKSAW